MKPRKQKLWVPKEPTKEVERGIWNENYLKRLHETLKQFRRKDSQHNKRKNFDKCSMKEPETPLTFLPIQTLDEDIDENYQNKILIQKTIKGRAIQSMLLNGMKKVQAAIQEAKETLSISAVRKLFPNDFSQQIDCQEIILSEYHRVEEILKNDKRLQEELKHFKSKDASNMLKYFGEEINRLQNEKQSQALYLLAERERYRREAENFGESSCEEQFKNDSVSLYLENVLLEGINRAFDENSRSVIREMAQKIDLKAKKEIEIDDVNEKLPFQTINKNEDFITEEVKNTKYIKHSDKKVITELLIDNLIPQFFYESKNERLILKQKEYLEKAHYDLYKDEIENLRLEEEIRFCETFVDEILESALDFVERTKLNESRQNSLEAELFASQIVEDILKEITSNNEPIPGKKSNDLFQE